MWMFEEGYIRERIDGSWCYGMGGKEGRAMECAMGWMAGEKGRRYGI